MPVDLTTTGLHFSSQADLKSFIQSIRKLYGFHTFNKDGDDGVEHEGKQYRVYDILFDMFSRHPDHSGLVPGGFRFEQGKLFPSEIACCFLATDGTWTCFSLMSKCVTGLATTLKQMRSKAFRRAVGDQIAAFKREQCVRCGSTKRLEVDHVKDFSLLVAEFMIGRGDPMICKEEGLCCFLSPSFTREWKAFHQANATLQVLCKSCHDEKSYGSDQNSPSSPK